MDLDNVVEKGKWYLKHRTKIWATIWFIVGAVGFNADRIVQYIPTAKDTLQQYESGQQPLKIEKKMEEPLDTEGVVGLQ